MAEQGLMLNIETLKEKKSEIDKIDEKLDAALGSESAGKRKIAKEYMEKTAELWQGSEKKPGMVVQAIEFLKKLDNDSLVGVFTAFSTALDDEFGDAVDKFLTQQMESRKKDQKEAKLSEAEIEQLIAVRKDAVKQFNIIKELLVFAQMFDPKNPAVPDPKTRRGSVGKKGPRAINTFNYTYDGTALNADENTLTAVAKKEGVETKALKEHISKNATSVDAEGNTVTGLTLAKGKMPDSWQSVLPSGKTLVATRMEGFEGYGQEDEEEEETPENGETSETENEPVAAEAAAV